jgi:hypothetical protein
MFRYLSASSTLASGAIGIGWCSDPMEKFPSGDGGVKRLRSLVPSSTGWVYEDLQINIPSGMGQSGRTWYAFEGDANDTDHGQVVALIMSALTALSKDSSTTFLFELEWTIEFSSPYVPNEVAEGKYVYASHGWYPYFTTSDTSMLSDTILIAKANSGGDPCEWDNLVPETIYELDSSAKLPYVADSAGTEKDDIKYAVQVWNVKYPTLTFFVSKEKAEKYAKTGDQTHCLKYFKPASKYVSPDNPAWKPVSSSSFSLLKSHHRPIPVKPVTDTSRCRPPSLTGLSLNDLKELELESGEE